VLVLHSSNEPGELSPWQCTCAVTKLMSVFVVVVVVVVLVVVVVVVVVVDPGFFFH